MRTWLSLLLLLAQPGVADVAAQREVAARTYDLGAAESLLPTLASLPESESVRVEQVRAHLLCAEIQRIAFEQLPEAEVQDRRALGKSIDAHAEAGLGLVERMAESSEKYRFKADLIGTMIRSNYRAGKMRGEMKSAVDEALRLDPANAPALVSQAKMQIFNPSASQNELREGDILLQRAIDLEPSLEQAKLLQAHARERLGEHERAVALWEECLRVNPDCAPARQALAPEKIVSSIPAPPQ